MIPAHEWRTRVLLPLSKARWPHVAGCAKDWSQNLERWSQGRAIELSDLDKVGASLPFWAEPDCYVNVRVISDAVRRCIVERNRDPGDAPDDRRHDGGGKRARACMVAGFELGGDATEREYLDRMEELMSDPGLDELYAEVMR